MMIIKKIFILSFAFVLLIPIEGSCGSISDLKNNPISFQSARIMAVAEFNRQTGDKFKTFRCAFVEETDEDWIFILDEFITPPPPGGADIMIFINKRTGKIRHIWGK